MEVVYVWRSCRGLEVSKACRYAGMQVCRHGGRVGIEPQRSGGLEVWRQSKALEEVEGSGGSKHEALEAAGSSGGGRELWKAATPVWRRQRGLETYAAYRILVTHPRLLAIHLRLGIHLDLLPSIHLRHAIDLHFDLLRVGLEVVEVVQVMQAWSRRGLEIWRYGDCVGMEARHGGM